MNIAKQILANYDLKKLDVNFHENPVYEASVNGRKVRLVTLDSELVNAQTLTDTFSDLELTIFISRHSSVSGTPTLSVHTSGNLGEAKLGGLPRKVSVSPANAMRDALKTMMKLKEEMQLDYEVSYECTHHGPSLNSPTMFVELGSSIRQWNDLKAAEVVAHAAMEAISKFGIFRATAVLGIGGPHYNMKFTRMMMEDEIAFGHIIPKYAVPSVDIAVLRQCVEKTLEKIEYTVLDWKGIKGQHKPKLVEMLEEIAVPFNKV